MVDIAAASAASSQIQVDAGRSSSQEKQLLRKTLKKAKLKTLSMNVKPWKPIQGPALAIR